MKRLAAWIGSLALGSILACSAQEPIVRAPAKATEPLPEAVAADVDMDGDTLA